MNRRSFLGWLVALAAAPVVKALAPSPTPADYAKAGHFLNSLDGPESHSLDAEYLRRRYIDPAVKHLHEQHERELHEMYLKAGDILTIRVPSIDPHTRLATGTVRRTFTIARELS